MHSKMFVLKKFKERSQCESVNLKLGKILEGAFRETEELEGKILLTIPEVLYSEKELLENWFTNYKRGIKELINFFTTEYEYTMTIDNFYNYYRNLEEERKNIEDIVKTFNMSTKQTGNKELQEIYYNLAEQTEEIIDIILDLQNDLEKESANRIDNDLIKIIRTFIYMVEAFRI